MNINSYMPVRIISGENCISKNKNVFTEFGEKCLIVTGGSSAKKSGAFDDVVTALNEKNIQYSVFDGITQNPYTDDCYKAAVIARNNGAEFVIGIGGGSSLDAAKAVAIYSTNPDIASSQIYDMTHKNKPLPLILVGTTAGTGSEVTGVSVLTNSENGMKKSISGADCYSAVSFCDYRYTFSVPYAVTVSTALDAFAHATESYFSSTANELSDIYAEKAFELLKEPLFYLCKNKSLSDEKMRENLYKASIYSGLCLNITGTCFPHTMSYILTEDYNVPHGKACAVFTPDLILIAEKYLNNKCVKMCAIMDTNINELIHTIKELADVDISISDKALKKYSNRWTDPQKNFSRTPGEFTTKSAVEILKRYN